MRSLFIRNKYNLFFLILGAILFTLSQVIAFDGLLGQDSYEYFRYSGRLKNYITNGALPGDFIWPIGYPLSISLLDLVINKLVVSAQLISVLSYIGCNILLFKFIKLLNPKASEFVSFIYVLVFLGFSPYFLRFGLTSMSDMLCAFFVLSAFYFYFLHQKNKEGKQLFFGIIFSVLAFITRNSSIVLVFIPAFLLGFYLLKDKKIKLIFLSLLAVLVLLTPTFLAGKSQLTGDGMSFTNFSFLNLFSFKTKGIEGVYTNDLPGIVYSFYGFFHPAYVFLGIVFLGIIFYKRINLDKVLLFSVLIFSVFLGVYCFQNKRFFVIQFPLILVLFYPAYTYLMSVFKTKLVKATFVLGCLIINLLLSVYTLKTAYNIQQKDVEFAQRMKLYEGKTLYTFEVDAALKSRGVNLNYNNLWEREYKNYPTGSLLLFNPGKFKDQWEGHLLMDNWKNIEQNYSLKKLDNFGGGWMLYEIN